ncbi:MAG TPA: glycosyltransferase [Candidatus Limnocylindria bacterium]|nr:glycosyltransferase [Candidatus Limnocylindria bacterium]
MPGTVLHLVANLDRGGAQEVVRTLVRALPATGWRPLVATFRDGPLRADIEADGVAVRVVTGREHSLASPLHAAGELRSIRGELRALMRDEHVDVVQTHLLGSTDFLTLAARDRGAPSVLWTVHNALLDLRPDQLPAGQRRLLGAKRAAYRIAYRLGGRRADGFVAVSDDVASAVERAYHPPRGRLFVIPNGIDVDRYGARDDRETVRDELGLTSPGHIVIVVAKLFAQKGHAVLLEALGSAGLGDEDVVLLVGEGPERESLERRVRERGLGGVRFLGNRPDVPRLLAASDLFVLPSLWEGLPMALLEAMASRLAVVATDVAGSRQVVIPGASGRQVPAGDPVALAANLRELLSNEAERERLADGARRRVEAEFSAARQAERHAAMYERVLARRQRS